MKWLLTVLIQLLFAIFMYVMGSLFFGAALVPGVALFLNVWHATAATAPILRLFLLGVSLSAGFFMFGLTLILLVGATMGGGIGALTGVVAGAVAGAGILLRYSP